MENYFWPFIIKFWDRAKMSFDFRVNFSCFCKRRTNLQKKKEKNVKFVNLRLFSVNLKPKPLGGCFVFYITKGENFHEIRWWQSWKSVKTWNSCKAVSKRRKINWWNVNWSSASTTLLLKYRQLQLISTATRSGAQNTDTYNPLLTIALNTLIEWL